MKKITVFLFLSFCFLKGNAQISSPSLTTVTTDQSIFSVHHGDEIITFYLKKEQYAPLSNGVYSVKGTMNHSGKNVEGKKSVVGIYDGASLTLFQLSDAKEEEKIITFDFKGDPRERINTIKNYSAFNIKMMFQRTNTKGIEGSYESSGTKTPLFMHMGSIAIANEQNILKLNTKNGIDLLQLSRFYRDVEIIAHNETSVLIKFSAPSTFYSNGRCAAGEESGMSWLRFTKSGGLKEVTMVVMESCLVDISIDDEKQLEDHITQYTIANYSNNTKKLAIVDTNKVSLTLVPVED